MKSRSLIYLSLFLLSASILCFEIVSTRITSVIFAYDYAFIILSLAILGIGTGGIFSYYRFKGKDISQAPRTFARVLVMLGLSLLVFLAAVTALKTTFPFAYFVLLLFPFFFAEVFYSLLFKSFAENSFKLYAADLSGAAFGSLLLSSLLVGMGLGSFFGRKICPDRIESRLKVICSGIILAGIALLLAYPIVLNNFMERGVTLRALLSFLMICPFGFLLGIPYPTAIQLLKRNSMEQYVPWMYGVNGTMTVLGSVVAVILSMSAGFSLSFLVGLFFYALVVIVVQNGSKVIAAD
jgi:hypothetical protein